MSAVLACEDKLGASLKLLADRTWAGQGRTLTLRYAFRRACPTLASGTTGRFLKEARERAVREPARWRASSRACPQRVEERALLLDQVGAQQAKVGRAFLTV